MGRIFIIGAIALIGGIVDICTGAGLLSGLAFVAMGLAILGAWGVWFRKRGQANVSVQLRRPTGRHWRKPAP